MSGERLELVRSFSELRAGMLVVVKMATCCGGNHRGMLTGRYDGDLNSRPTCRSWSMVPTAHDYGYHGSDGRVVASEATISEGRCFRVIDPDADKAETTETEKPRKLVKT